MKNNSENQTPKYLQERCGEIRVRRRFSAPRWRRRRRALGRRQRGNVQVGQTYKVHYGWIGS